jgi:5-carboxymethyl-2-hydroxymuconate isomerase
MLMHASVGLLCACAGVYVPEEATYDDFVRVSKEIMKGRNTDQQREVVAKVLQSLMPEQAPGVFR